ncbi:MAG: glyoxalase [Chloroflexi bacterium]|nr:glyoxalase [Chloroflexota bacterium]
MMTAHLNMVTLGTRDFDSMRDFYLRLGWQENAAADCRFANFHTGSSVLALYPRSASADDEPILLTIDPDQLLSSNLAVWVDDPTQVDLAIESAREAGAEILVEPRAAFWGGRSAYFSDPEGNVWEITWNPNAAALEPGGVYWA